MGLLVKSLISSVCRWIFASDVIPGENQTFSTIGLAMFKWALLTGIGLEKGVPGIKVCITLLHLSLRTGNLDAISAT